jgi:hypothetical protein
MLANGDSGKSMLAMPEFTKKQLIKHAKIHRWDQKLVEKWFDAKVI